MSKPVDGEQLETMEFTPSTFVLDWTAPFNSQYLTSSPVRVTGDSSWYFALHGQFSAPIEEPELQGGLFPHLIVFLCHRRKSGSGDCRIRICGKLGCVADGGVYKSSGRNGPILLDYTISCSGQSERTTYSSPFILPCTSLDLSYMHDTVKLRAEVEYVVEAPAEWKGLQVPGTLTPFQESFRGLYESGLCCDFVLVSSDGVEKVVHRAILIARSPVFAAMFQSNLKESQTGRCIIDDVTASVLDVLVKHMYYECTDADLDKEVEDIFLAADKYQVSSLVKQCERHLIRKLAVGNIMDLLYLTDGINAPSLKNAAFSFIRTNSAAFKRSGAIKKLCEKASPELVAEVLTFLLPA